MVHYVQTVAEFDKLVEESKDKLLVADFTASWCGPCQNIAPSYEALGKKAEGKGAIFVKVDVDSNPDTASKYGINAMPTFVFFKAGKPLADRVLGADKAKLLRAVNGALGLAGGDALEY